jgi:hypothetical protein
MSPGWGRRLADARRRRQTGSGCPSPPVSEDPVGSGPDWLLVTTRKLCRLCRNPKAAPSHQPALSSSRPKPRRMVSRAEAPSMRAPPSVPREAEASVGPNERSRWPRELPHLQGFDPRGDPPHTCRLFRPTRGA